MSQEEKDRSEVGRWIVMNNPIQVGQGGQIHIMPFVLAFDTVKGQLRMLDVPKPAENKVIPASGPLREVRPQ